MPRGGGDSGEGGGDSGEGGGDATPPKTSDIRGKKKKGTPSRSRRKAPKKKRRKSREDLAILTKKTSTGY